MKLKNFTHLYILLLLCAALPLRAQSAWSPDATVPHNHFAGGYMWQRLQRPQLTKAGSGEYRILVILAQYSDVSFFYDAGRFTRMLDADGYSEGGAQGSARNYLEAQLGAKVEITVVGPVTVSKERSYYGQNTGVNKDRYPGTFVAEACIAAAPEVDFSRFDMDGDGYVDNVFVFYPGEDEAQCSADHPEYMWSHSYNLLHSDYGKELEYNGVKVNNYACSSELFRVQNGDTVDSVMAPIGTFCHEYLHNFAIPDFYDSDYEKSGGIAAGFWTRTSLMDGGNYNNRGNTPANLNVVERECLGIVTPEELTAGNKLMYPVGSGKETVYRISNPDDKEEYYLFEVRALSGWDSYIGISEESGMGMLLYHIDKSSTRKSDSETFGSITAAERWNRYNEVNARPDNQCADLIEADGRSDKNPTAQSKSDIAGIFFPHLGASAIGGDSKIKLSFRSGGTSRMALQNIRKEGDAMAFTAVNLDSPLPPEPVDPPSEQDYLYIIVQRTPQGTLLLRVNNSVGATVEWFFNSQPIQPDGSFKPSSAGTIEARVNWPDGSVDYLFCEQK